MKSFLIGFDAFDPNIFERLSGEGRLPHLTKLADQGGYSRFGVSNPPQSEVSWTSIATGLNPGGHGIFDFVHRNPADYSLHVSLLPTKSGLLGTHFTSPHGAQTIFQAAVDKGYPATSLWWPATFPARQGSPVHTIPGLGAPDILGRLGAGFFFSPDICFQQEDYKTHVDRLIGVGRGTYTGVLRGPLQKKKGETTRVGLEFRLTFDEGVGARLQIGKEKIHLTPGEWGPFLHLTFRVKLGFTVHAITRAILYHQSGIPGLYFLPLQIEPMRSIWPYASPKGFIKDIWVTDGPFLTLGWPQDTTGLEEGFFSDDAFCALCESILSSREQILERQLSSFNEGVLAIVFDSLDRIQHMFWRDRPDIIDAWYEKLDALFGRLMAAGSFQQDSGARLLVLSDHGFTRFDFKVHTNQWLQENGYLTVKPAIAKDGLQGVEWSKTKAYALGLNSLYINQAGREAQGIVSEDERDSLLNELSVKLLAWQGPDGERVVHGVWPREKVFEGPMTTYGPDLVIGFNHGYRASSQTGLGGWGTNAIESNQDHWSGDHCIDPALVEGVLFANTDLRDFPAPSYRDIPQLALGVPLQADVSALARVPEFSDEDREVLEERLKDLGYL